MRPRPVHALGLAGAVLAVSATTRGERAASPPRTPALAIAAVHVAVKRARVMVTTDATIPRSWAAGLRNSVTGFASYGGPGVPLALDAQIVTTPAGRLVAPAGLAGKRLRTRFAASAPASSGFVLGARQKAGTVLELSRDDVVTAAGPSGLATLRLRAVRPMPAEGPDGSRELLIRLGGSAGAPFVLGTLRVTGDPIETADARFCGSGPDSKPLAVLTDRGATDGTPPVLSRRRVEQSLCVRLFLGPPRSPRERG